MELFGEYYGSFLTIDLFFSPGFVVELDRVKNLPYCETETFEVKFDPRGANLNLGEINTVMPIQVQQGICTFSSLLHYILFIFFSFLSVFEVLLFFHHIKYLDPSFLRSNRLNVPWCHYAVCCDYQVVGGPAVQVHLCAVVTMPSLTVSTDTLQFDSIQCGLCQVTTVQLFNPEPVPCEWSIAEEQRPRKKVHYPTYAPIYCTLLPPAILDTCAFEPFTAVG